MTNKIKEVVRGYWKAFIETLITGILVAAFSQTNTFLLFVGITWAITDIIIMAYSIYQGDPKYIIISLLVGICGGSRHG